MGNAPMIMKQGIKKEEFGPKKISQDYNCNWDKQTIGATVTPPPQCLKTQKEDKKIADDWNVDFCTIIIYFNDLRFKKQNFPKICWDILWFIKGHPLKCKKS